MKKNSRNELSASDPLRLSSGYQQSVEETI